MFGLLSFRYFFIISFITNIKFMKDNLMDELKTTGMIFSSLSLSLLPPQCELIMTFVFNLTHFLWQD